MRWPFSRQREEDLRAELQSHLDRFTGVTSAFLFGLTATDPATLAASVVALVVTGLGAASVPAWRGSQVDPMQALREE